MLQEYDDYQVVEFLKYGWPANRLPGPPAPTINVVNHNSAVRHLQFINDYLRKELSYGSILGPFEEIPFEGC